MARRGDTREALLNAGVELFLEGGYDFTGTNAILERAETPRGSFYHHFIDKQDYALATAEHYYERHLPLLDRILADETRSPLHRLRAYFEALRGYYEAESWDSGCLLGLLGQELAGRNETSRLHLAGLFGRWRNRLSACLREARDRGELEPDADCEELSGFLLDGWEGALIGMKVSKSGGPLDRFIKLAFDRVLAPR